MRYDSTYRTISDIRCTKFQNLNASHLVLQFFAQFIEARRLADNEDVVGAAPTDDAPTTSDLSTIILPTRVHVILEVWQYMQHQ